MTILNATKILVIAAHPDDDVLGCGGTIARLREKSASIRVVFLGEGSTSRFDTDAMQSADALKAIEQRQQWARGALSLLGVSDVVFHNSPCSRFDTVPVLELGKLVEKEIASFKPDTILTHSHVDANVDHRLTHQAVLQATRPGSAGGVSHVYAFEIPSSTEWRFTEAFTPNVFINIESTIEKKLAAMEVYKTEVRNFPFPRSRQGLLVRAQTRGSQAGLPAAEAFMLIRSILK